MQPNERVTQDRPPARDGANEQPTLYGDIKPDPITTATFHKGDRPLLVPAYGIGVDSTSVLVKLKRLGIRPDLILTADVGLEWPETYAYLPIINVMWN